MEYRDNQEANNNFVSYPPSQATEESRNGYDDVGNTAYPYSDYMVDPNLNHTGFGVGSFGSGVPFSSYANTNNYGSVGFGGDCVNPFSTYDTNNVGGSSFVEPVPLASFPHSNCRANWGDGSSGDFSSYPASMMDNYPQASMPFNRGYDNSFFNVAETSTHAASTTQVGNYPRLTDAVKPSNNRIMNTTETSENSSSKTLAEKRHEITKTARGGEKQSHDSGKVAAAVAKSSSDALIGAPPKYANSPSEFLVNSRPKLVERFRRNRAIMIESFETLIGHWVDQARVPVEMSDQAIERAYLARSCGIFKSIATSGKRRIRDACEKIERSRKNAVGSRPTDDDQRVPPESTMSSSHQHHPEQRSSKHKSSESSTTDDELLELAVAYISDHAGLLFSSHEAFLMFVESKSQNIRKMTEDEKDQVWKNWPGSRFEA